MAFDSQANQGGDGSSSSGEGSDANPGGYRPPPGFAPPPPPPPPPPGGGWSPPGAPGPSDTQIVYGGAQTGYPPPAQPGYGPPPGYYGGAPPAPPGFGPPPGPGPGPGIYGGYPSGYGYSGAAVRRTDSTAIAALVLSIASFVFCPLILAVVALALIPGARRTINASGGTIDGLGMVTAAKIISWINIGLCALVLAAIVIAAIASSGTSPSNAPSALIRF